MSDNFYSHLRNRLKIEKLLKHPSIVATVFDGEDTATFLARKPLVAQRAEIRAGKYSKPQAVANAKLATAAEKRRLAKIAYAAAVDEEVAAFSAASTESYREACELADAERELSKTADPRIWLFYNYVDSVWDAVRHSFRIDVVEIASLHNPRKYEDNTAQMKPALELLALAKADAEELRFMAISRTDLTARLKAWCEKMAPVLVPFNLKPPKISDEDVEEGQSPWPAPQASGNVVGITLQ